MSKVNLKKLTDCFFVEKVNLARAKLRFLSDYRFIAKGWYKNEETISIDLPFLLKIREEYLILPLKEDSIPRKKTIFFSYFPFFTFIDIHLDFYYENTEKKLLFDFGSFDLPSIKIEDGQVAFLLIFFVALKGLIR